mmetsp:Transcript_15877/g.31854  ORF Transcript_15877/g.31854 Transcript_15877/m.31854 type:complete len:82 (-) Transcript_15877:1708-1953(-)
MVRNDGVAPSQATSQLVLTKGGLEVPWVEIGLGARGEVTRNYPKEIARFHALLWSPAVAFGVDYDHHPLSQATHRSSDIKS